MTAATGAYSPRTLSRLLPSELARTLAEVLVLLAVGLLAVLLHQALRAPLHLPGRQGLIWMGLLATGRSASRQQWAGTTIGLGAGLGAFGCFLDPLSGFIYSLSGVFVDWAYTALPGMRARMWLFAGACGLVHALKPLLRYGIDLFTPLPHGSLAFGLAYPLTTHFLFGAAGALAGLFLLKNLKGLRRPG